MYTLQVRVVKVDDNGKVKGAVREVVFTRVTPDLDQAITTMHIAAGTIEYHLETAGMTTPEEEV